MSKSPSLRRIQADVRELALDPSDRYYAAPLENDMFEWHFTIRGADGTDFEGGMYHGRILLPPEYPFKPPHILFLTPSGRFETNTKVCLSFTAFHAELWRPAWGIRLILEALISFLPTPADGAIGALDWTSAERKKLAIKSQNFCCAKCGAIKDLLPELSDTPAKKSSQFSKEIEHLQKMQAINESKKEAPKKDDESKASEQDATSSAIQCTVVPPSPPTSRAAPSTVSQAESQEPKQANAPTSTPTGTTSDSNEVEEEELTVQMPPATLHNDDTLHAIAATLPPPQNNPWEYDISWMTDPMLNIAILLLSMICWLFMRWAYALMQELAELRGSVPFNEHG